MEVDSSLSGYRIFNTVARIGNISLAAKELYISQPAISKAINKLESDLNCTLFQRNSRGVTLTEEGETLYNYTKSAFEALTEGENTLKRIHSLGIGHIRIGVSNTLCKYILLPYLKEFVALHPHIRFTILCQSTYKTLKLLEEGKVDIGLIGKPDSLHEMNFYPIDEIQDTFVATNDYLENFNLREEGNISTGKIFEKANLMLLDEKNITRVYIDDYFKKNDMMPEQILEVTSMDLLIEFAKISLGVACVIKEFVKQELEQGILVEIPLTNPIEKREIGFAYKQTTKIKEAVQLFVEYYEKC